MNFELTEQQLSIQKMARDFTEKKVAPGVLERDETRVYDVELYKELSSMEHQPSKSCMKMMIQELFLQAKVLLFLCLQ